MWGIAAVSALLLLAITVSWAIEGRIGFRLRSFGSESVGEILREASPLLFWAVAGFGIAAGIVGVIVTSIGLSKVQRDEDEPA
jgi:hypothetical protein